MYVCVFLKIPVFNHTLTLLYAYFYASTTLCPQHHAPSTLPQQNGTTWLDDSTKHPHPLLQYTEVPYLAVELQAAIQFTYKVKQ